MRRNLTAALYTIAICLAFSTVMTTAQEARKPIMLGGYREVGTDDKEVVAAAEFAVNAQGEKQSAAIKLTSVNRAERQSAAGSNFKLCLTIEIEGDDDEDSVTQQVRVVVHRDLKGEYSLTSWEEADCLVE